MSAMIEKKLDQDYENIVNFIKTIDGNEYINSMFKIKKTDRILVERKIVNSKGCIKIYGYNEIHKNIKNKFNNRKENIIIKCETIYNGKKYNKYHYLNFEIQINKCSYCKKEQKKLKKCSNCHVANYCDTECQKDDWKEKHKIECYQIMEKNEYDNFISEFEEAYFLNDTKDMALMQEKINKFDPGNNKIFLTIEKMANEYKFGCGILDEERLKTILNEEEIQLVDKLKKNHRYIFCFIIAGKKNKVIKGIEKNIIERKLKEEMKDNDIMIKYNSFAKRTNIEYSKGVFDLLIEENKNKKGVIFVTNIDNKIHYCFKYLEEVKVVFFNKAQYNNMVNEYKEHKKIDSIIIVIYYKFDNGNCIIDYLFKSKNNNKEIIDEKNIIEEVD